jgi:hypothetical protein
MWGPYVALIAGGQTEAVTISSDEYIGNLWDYLGNPSNPLNINFTVDAADAAEIIIPLDFHPGCTFQFTAINGGRFIGVAGAGGDGGADLGSTGEAGRLGADGGHAINSDTFPVNIDVDDGYLLGGGGGGGGGSFDDTGTGGTPGGGGGGGEGWGDAAGGAAGFATGVPIASPGTAGSRTSAGLGGDGGSSATNGGGDGGNYGFGGVTGRSTNLLGASGTFFYYGGVGGEAGNAFRSTNGSTATFNGAKSEATLRSENRIMGETSATRLVLNTFYSNDASVSGASTHSISFLATGDIEFVSSPSGPSGSQTGWLTVVGGTPGTGYEFRPRSLAGDGDGSFTSEPTPSASWTTLSSPVSWSLTSSAGTQFAAQLVEVRRNDAGATADQVMASCYLRVRDENGV